MLLTLPASQERPVFCPHRPGLDRGLPVWPRKRKEGSNGVKPCLLPPSPCSVMGVREARGRMLDARGKTRGHPRLPSRISLTSRRSSSISVSSAWYSAILRRRKRAVILAFCSMPRGAIGNGCRRPWLGRGAQGFASKLAPAIGSRRLRSTCDRGFQRTSGRMSRSGLAGIAR